jgi:hypothetical protein
MTAVTRSGAARSGPHRWWVVTGVLALVGGCCIAVGLQDHRHPLAGPVVAPSTLTTAPATIVGTIPVPVVARSVPVSLRVPAIALSVPLSTLGLNRDGTVQVPDNIQEPGWFRLGPTPGQIGSAVILGHVDSYQGEGVFFQLRALLAGDQVQVSLRDGAVTNFVVTAVDMYTKTQFPAQRVYTSDGHRTLQLVTCGGTFDTATSHYLSNIVVFTSFVSATAATTPVATAPPVIAVPPVTTATPVV